LDINKETSNLDIVVEGIVAQRHSYRGSRRRKGIHWQCVV